MNPSIVFSILCLCLQVLATVASLVDKSDSSDEPDWDFEPRTWSPDEQENPDSTFDSSDLLSDKFSQDLPSDENQHNRHHYLGEKIQLKQTGNECSQFRVDTREAIVCDKTRCDKLDVEWPQYDNQIKLIETTKHGMRFHQADFAFTNSRSFQSAAKEKQPTRQANKDLPIKLDIFDFLKPKTTTANPKSSPSYASTSTTTTTTTTTTSAPQSARPNIGPLKTDNSTGRATNTTRLVTTLRLETGRRMQTMIGFGGALSDSTCRNIKSLSPAMAKSLMEDYFGNRGIRYNIARMSMGSSDFSTSPYTNNDRSESMNRLAIDQGDDVDMSRFRLTEEDYEYKLPVARQAIATSRQEIKFVSSLWSPPIWMKNNSHIVHGYLKGDVYGPYYKALAELIVRWLEAYKKNGINFWATTALNEPVTGVLPFIFHNSLGITRDDYVTFIKLYLGPMLQSRGLADVKLLILDDNKGYIPKFARKVFEDQEASKYVAGVAVHWYMNDEYENLNFLAKEYPNKFILSTEACNGFLPFQVHALPGNWDRGVAYMYDIIKLVQKNAAGWVDWNMALDLGGGPTWIKNNLDAPIIVNAQRDEYYKSPMFYALGHFSRFVERNSTRLDYRIANAQYDYPFEVVAFHDPKGYIVIVALNANHHPVPLRVIVGKQLIRVVTLRADSFNTIIFKWKSKTTT